MAANSTDSTPRAGDVEMQDAITKDIESPDAPVEYHASPRYWILAILAFGAAILLAADLARGLHWDSILFILMGLVGGLWALWMATTRVLITPEGVWVRRFSATYFVDFHQMLSASIQGRIISTLSIAYHPRLANGLVDTDRVGALLIPGLIDQEELLERIEGRIPA